MKRKPVPPGSTVINISGPVRHEAIEEISENFLSDEQAVQKFLCEYIIPDNKSEALVGYLTDQRKRFPHIKNDRLLRKSAEYFKLQRIIFVNQ